MNVLDAATARASIISVGRWLDSKGWAPAIDNNYSVRLGDGSFAVTDARACKGRLGDGDILAVDGQGRGAGADASGDFALHLMIYRLFPEAGAVLHSLSPATVALTRALASDDRWLIEGQDLPLALAPAAAPFASVAIPIISNSQDLTDVEAAAWPRLQVDDAPRAFFVRNRGLYGWGATLAEAERLIEAVEWLVACELATRIFHLPK